MYQFHGWFTLYETLDDSDSSESTRVAVDDVRPYLQRLQSDRTAGYVRVYNGFWFVTLAGTADRPDPFDGYLDELLRFIASRMTGSFGILHEGDDQRTGSPGPNAFRVRTLARGTITERQDPFFSPRKPVIED